MTLRATFLALNLPTKEALLTKLLSLIHALLPNAMTTKLRLHNLIINVILNKRVHDVILLCKSLGVVKVRLKSHCLKKDYAIAIL